jgi:hypothetical protein
MGLAKRGSSQGYLVKFNIHFLQWHTEFTLCNRPQIAKILGWYFIL